MVQIDLAFVVGGMIQDFDSSGIITLGKFNDLLVLKLLTQLDYHLEI